MKNKELNSDGDLDQFYWNFAKCLGDGSQIIEMYVANNDRF